MLGMIEGRRRRGRQWIRWLDRITNSMDEFEQTPGVSEGQGNLAYYGPWGHRVKHDLAIEQHQCHLRFRVVKFRSEISLSQEYI